MKLLSLFMFVFAMTNPSNAFMEVSEKEIIATGISSYYLQVSHAPPELDYVHNQGAIFRAKTEAMSDALRVAKYNCLGTLAKYKEIETPADNIPDHSFPNINVHYTIQAKCLKIKYDHLEN